MLVADFQEAWHLLHDGRLVAYDTSNKKTFVKVCNKYSNIPRQKKLLKKTKKNKNAQLTKNDAFLYWSSSCPMWWWATARNLGGCYSGLFHFGGLLA